MVPILPVALVASCVCGILVLLAGPILVSLLNFSFYCLGSLGLLGEGFAFD